MAKRRILRTIIDILAMTSTAYVAHQASGSWLSSVAACILLGAYGFFCFWDGITIMEDDYDH